VAHNLFEVRSLRIQADLSAPAADDDEVSRPTVALVTAVSSAGDGGDVVDDVTLASRPVLLLLLVQRWRCR